MKTKKLISLFCAAAMTVSSFAGLTITASAASGDKIADVVAVQDFNSLETGVLLDGFDEAEKKSDAVPYFNMVTTNRKDVGHYTDKNNVEIVTGNVYSVMEKEDDTTNKYIRLGFPMFGDFTKNGRYGHIDFVDADKTAVKYTADATKDYVIEFDARFISGMAKGVVSTEGSYNPVLRIGTFDAGTKTANAVAIDKAALNIGDDWVHVKSVTSIKGTKVYLDGAEEYVASETTATAVNAFGLYSTDGQTTISPPQDVFNGGFDKEILDADKHTFSPTVDIDNFTIYTAEPEVEADITITYEDEAGTEIKTATTVSGIVGRTFKVSENYKAPIDAEGDNYYKYKSGADDITVAASDNVIDLVFESVAKPTVTFKATTGDSKTELAEIGTAKAMPGTNTAAIYAKEYIQADGKWYQKNDGRKGGGKNHDAYDLTAVAGDEDSVVTVDYKPAFNVVSVLEAEDSDNAVEGSIEAPAGGTYGTTYPILNASGGAWAQSTTGSTYPTGFYTEPVTEAGTYEVTIRTRDFKRPAAVAKVTPGEGDAVTMAKIGETPSDGGISFTTIKVELAAGEYIWVGKSGEIGTDESSSTKLINDVDYIVVKDANKKADTDPVVTFNYANKVASLTSDKDRTVKAVVIHAQYGGGILTDVKQHPVDILSGAAPTTVNIEEPVYEGDKFMVWETLDGLKPLLVPAYTVPQGSGDAKPKFTVTVAEGIANGTVTPDKAQAEQGETVTLTVTPAQGYVLDTLTVKDADNADITVTNNTFTMPAKNVTVTATFKAQIAGTVTIAGTAKVGETITATVAELPAGATAKYQWQLATAQDGEFTDVQGANEASKKLSSVSQDKYVRVVVTADGFDGQLVSNVLGPVGEAAAPITKYAITKVVDPADTATVTTIGDGTAVDEVTDGINVTVNATATGDNAVKEIVVTETEGGAPVAFNAETKTFKMPAKAVTVTVKTAPLFAITKAAAENGSFTVSADKAAEGTAITVTPTANEGYKVDTVKFNDTVIEAEDGAYSFTMPAMAVTVTVTFASTDKAVYLIGTKGNPVSFAEGNQGNWTAGGSTLTATVDSASDKPSVNLKNNANGGSCYYYSTFAETSDIMDLSFEVKPTSGSLALNINKDGWNTWTNHTNIAIINEDSINYGSEKIADLTKGEWNTVKISMDLQLGTITFTVGDNASVTKPMLAFDSKSYQSNDGGVKPVSVTMLRFVHNNKSASDMNFTNFLLKATPRETELPKKTLTVSKNIDGGKAYIGAEGTVTSEVTQSTNVIATAEGTETVRFNAWKDAGGNVLATTPTITRRMYADETITADFTQLYTAELTYTLDGAGVEGIEVSVGETKKTTDANGKVTFIFEPGTYTATTIAGDYKATSKEITIGTANVTDTVTLESNAQTLAAIDIDSSMMNTGILTTAADSKVVGKLSTKQYANVEKTEEMVTPANIEWSASNAGIAVDADGTVTITNAVTAGDYTITATAGGVTATYDLTVAATGTEKVKAASEDFEGTTNIFGAPLVTDYDTFGYREVSGFTNVFLMGKEAEKTVTFSPVMFANADTTVFKTDVYYGWDNATSGSTVALLDDQDNVVASWTINNNVSAAAGTPQISAIIGGTAATGNIDTLNMWSGSNGVNNSNGWSNRPYKAGEHGTVTVTVATNGDVTIDFNNNNHNDKFVRTGQVTGTTTSTNISKIKINSTHKSADRMISLDNLLTTQVKSE